MVILVEFELLVSGTTSGLHGRTQDKLLARRGCVGEDSI